LAAPEAPDVDALLEADLLPPVRERQPFESVEPPFELSSPASIPGGPTAEQLGQTIELEEARGPELELDATAASSALPAQAEPELEEELEVTLPGRQALSSYAENPLAPTQAFDQLETTEGAFESEPAPPASAEVPVLAPAIQEFSAPAITPADSEPATPNEWEAPREGEPLIEPIADRRDADSIEPTEAGRDARVEASEARVEPAVTSPELFERSTLQGVTVQEIVPGTAAPARPSTFAALLDASIALGG
jgi:hypothetical protein